MLFYGSLIRAFCEDKRAPKVLCVTNARGSDAKRVVPRGPHRPIVLNMYDLSSRADLARGESNLTAGLQMLLELKTVESAAEVCCNCEIPCREVSSCPPIIGDVLWLHSKERFAANGRQRSSEATLVHCKCVLQPVGDATLICYVMWKGEPS